MKTREQAMEELRKVTDQLARSSPVLAIMVLLEAGTIIRWIYSEKEDERSPSEMTKEAVDESKRRKEADAVMMTPADLGPVDPRKVN